MSGPFNKDAGAADVLPAAQFKIIVHPTDPRPFVATTSGRWYLGAAIVAG